MFLKLEFFQNCYKTGPNNYQISSAILLIGKYNFGCHSLVNSDTFLQTIGTNNVASLKNKTFIIVFT